MHTKKSYTVSYPDICIINTWIGTKIPTEITTQYCKAETLILDYFYPLHSDI